MMDSEDGQLFIKNLAHFVRTHEKALANALQLRRQQTPRNGQTQSLTGVGSSGASGARSPPTSNSLSSSSTSSTLAAALSLPYLNFASHNIKPAKLSLTPHHLFYLLSRFEDLGIPVGPMNVRLENLHADTSTGNYVSFLSQSRRSNARGSDRASIHSVSSVRSVMSGMSSIWSNWGLGGGSSAAKSEKQRAQIQADLTYLYSAFTKIPCLRLAPDRHARLIEGYEEFPFDTAVPLIAFKNISALEISDIDIRQFYGWDRLADQLRSLTVKRAGVDDPADLLINIVLDDMDKRRRRSSKAQLSPTTAWATPASPKRSPTLSHATLVKSNSAPGSPDSSSSKLNEVHDVHPASLSRSGSDNRGHRRSHSKDRQRSNSPVRPPSARGSSSHGHNRGSYKVKRSGSGSSHSSMSDSWYTHHRGSSSNLLAMNALPPTKWRFLKHLSLADNSLTAIPAEALVPLANTLHSLDLSANLFAQIPDSLASLTALRALNLSNCMIDSLHSLLRNPLPAITALNLRANRLQSLAGIERLYPLERLDLRDNKITDPTELARLTGIPELREIWVSGNPFTKTHSDYRITIFNLFRKSPGYTEDIIIDSTGPGYNERRQLVERVAERPNVPVIRPSPAEVGPTPITVSKPTIIYGDAQKAPAVLRKERPSQPVSTPSTTSEIHKSSRRRKAPRRRMVDLSTNDTSPVQPKSTVRFVHDDRPLPPIPAHEPMSPISPKVLPLTEPVSTSAQESVSAESEHTVESDSGYGVSPKSPAPHSKPAVPPKSTVPKPIAVPKNDIPRLDASSMPMLSPVQPEYDPISVTPNKEPTPRDWSLSGELYRQKIEALRNEVGNNWLTALNEEGWDIGKHGQLSPSDFSPPSTMGSTPRVASQQSVQTIHSGRTLG